MTGCAQPHSRDTASQVADGQSLHAESDFDVHAQFTWSARASVVPRSESQTAPWQSNHSPALQSLAERGREGSTGQGALSKYTGDVVPSCDR